MSRQPITRMDVDTGWAYNRKLRRLQQAEPQRWPIFWSCYMALLGEAWQRLDRRLTLVDAWVPSMPCTPAEAQAALLAARIVDKAGRVPLASWNEWVGPALERIRRGSDHGLLAAHNRWHVGPFERCQLCKNAPALPEHSPSNAPRQPRQPDHTTPTTARRGARGARIDSGPEHVGGSLRALGFYPPGEHPEGDR